jgi:hypothetical protein
MARTLPLPPCGGSFVPKLALRAAAPLACLCNDVRDREEFVRDAEVNFSSYGDAGCFEFFCVGCAVIAQGIEIRIDDRCRRQSFEIGEKR